MKSNRTSLLGLAFLIVLALSACASNEPPPGPPDPGPDQAAWDSAKWDEAKWE